MITATIADTDTTLAEALDALALALDRIACRVPDLSEGERAALAGRLRDVTTSLEPLVMETGDPVVNQRFC